MKVLVLGGAGYIGSHTAYALIDEGHEVVIVDNLETGYEKAVHPKARFYKGDIRDRAFMDSVFEKELDIDGVIHFAANSLVAESMTNPLKYYDNNVTGTRVVLASMEAHGIKRIVFSSTAATYGEPKYVPIEESAENCPTNAYGETKLAMEKMMKWTDHAYGIRYVALRYFNACGARVIEEDGKRLSEIGEAHNPETHLIPIILQVANKKRENITLYGNDYPTEDGTCVRDYIHVCDIASAHILAMKYLMNDNVSNTFNLGSGNGYSNLELVQTASKVTKIDIPFVYGDRRAGDPAILIASNKKAKEILGWNLQYDNIEKIMEDAWTWHKSHPNGYN